MSQNFDFLGCGACINSAFSTWSLVGMVWEGFLVDLGPKCRDTGNKGVDTRGEIVKNIKVTNSYLILHIPSNNTLTVPNKIRLSK